MKKIYLTPIINLIELKGEILLAGSEKIRITGGSGDEQLNRERRNDWDNIWSRQ